MKENEKLKNYIKIIENELQAVKYKEDKSVTNLTAS